MSASAVLHSIAEGEETVSAEAKVSRSMKRDASVFLAEHNLTFDDALRMVIEAAALRLGGVPSYWYGPNADTREAMAELERGEGKTYHSVAEMMADLNADD